MKNEQDKKQLQRKQLLNEIVTKDAKSLDEKVTKIRLSREIDKIRFEAAFKTLLKR